VVYSGCCFHSDAKILPLAYYDLIIGMDWLVQHSPMQVDWAQKWLIIPYEGASQALQGELTTLPPGIVVQVTALAADKNTSPCLTHPKGILASVLLLTKFHWYQVLL